MQSESNNLAGRQPVPVQYRHGLRPADNDQVPALPVAGELLEEADRVEYCPVSVGAKLLGDRWCLLILREMICGTERFNEIHRSLPGISRSILAGRLRYLERHGLVVRMQGEKAKAGYRLTDAGWGVRSIVVAIGDWAIDWKFPPPAESESDSILFLWRVYQGADRSALPPGRVTIEFEFDNGRPRYGWLVLNSGVPTLCVDPPGFEPDLRVRGSVPTWLAVWFGHKDYAAAVARGDIEFYGPSELSRQFRSWFPLNRFALAISGRDAAPSRTGEPPTVVNVAAEQ